MRNPNDTNRKSPSVERQASNFAPYSATHQHCPMTRFAASSDSHNTMHLIVDNVTSLSKVNRIYHFVVSIVLVAVQIGGLTTVTCAFVRPDRPTQKRHFSPMFLCIYSGEGRLTRVVEEKGVVRTGILDQPVHGAQDVGLGRLAHGVLLVIRQQDHVFAGVAEVLVEVGGHVLDVVDAAAQLPFLVEVVDTDQESLSLAGAAGVLEVVSLGSAMAEGDGVTWRRSRAAVMALPVGVLVGIGRGCCAISNCARERRRVGAQKTETGCEINAEDIPARPYMPPLGAGLL